MAVARVWVDMVRCYVAAVCSESLHKGASMKNIENCPLYLTLLLVLISKARAFIHSGHSSSKRATNLLFSTQQDEEDIQVIGVVAPLHYSGPYACLGLDFHHLKQNENAQLTGTSINFVLDTGANINAIRKDLAQSLELPTVISKESFSAIKSAGVGGSFEAGNVVMLGDCHLSNMPNDVLFMRNMTAAAVDIGLAGAVGGGLLGTSFFDCFSAVEFDWYGTDGDPPTLIFYYKDLPEYAKENAFCVKLKSESFFNVPMMAVAINGVDVTAIIDTGSCISIVSPEIAKDLGLEKLERNDGHLNSVKVAGVDRGRVDLAKAGNASITIANATLADVDTLFVGQLPGLALAGGFGDKVPQALIGLDVLKRMYRMIVRLSEKEIWFEEIQTQ